jgi:hypothetical protein
MSSDKKDKDKKKDKKEVEKEKKSGKADFISENKLDAIYANLDANKYTSLSFKTKFPTDTTKLFKHARKSTALNALELIGVGTAPINTKEIIQLLEASTTLTFFRLSDHGLDAPSLARICSLCFPFDPYFMH